jgi:hypothetical protein
LTPEGTLLVLQHSGVFRSLAWFGVIAGYFHVQARRIDETLNSAASRP